MFEHFLVLHWAGGVQHDNDEIAGAGHCDDLLTSTLAVLGALDDTWEIEQLYLGSFELEDTGDAG
jgi:hypothetical protein